jgi:tetratricopeptide (TPR) repeat protein
MKTKQFILVTLVLLLSGAVVYSWKLSENGDPSLRQAQRPSDRAATLENDKKVPIGNAAEAEAYYVEAAQAIESTNLGKAEELYQKLLKIDANDAKASYGLAVVHALKEKPLEAVEQLHDAFRSDKGLVEKAILDPRLEPLKFDKHFQDLLRIEGVSIPEMYRQLHAAPIANEGDRSSDIDQGSFENTNQ